HAPGRDEAALERLALAHHVLVRLLEQQLCAALLGLEPRNRRADAGNRRLVLRLRHLVLALGLIELLARGLDLLARPHLRDLADDLPLRDRVVDLEGELREGAAAARAELPQPTALREEALPLDPLGNAPDKAPDDHTGKHDADDADRKPPLRGGDLHQLLEAGIRRLKRRLPGHHAPPVEDAVLPTRRRPAGRYPPI